MATELTDRAASRRCTTRRRPGCCWSRSAAPRSVGSTEALKPSGLTPRHFGVLFEVRARPTSQQALIDSIGVDPSKLVGLLNDLEAEGLIVRRRDPDDRRRHIVEVSKEGQRPAGGGRAGGGEVEGGLFAGLDDGQRAELHALLAQVADSSGDPRGLRRVAPPLGLTAAQKQVVNCRKRRGVEQSGSSPGS